MKFLHLNIQKHEIFRLDSVEEFIYDKDSERLDFFMEGRSVHLNMNSNNFKIFMDFFENESIIFHF